MYQLKQPGPGLAAPCPGPEVGPGPVADPAPVPRPPPGLEPCDGLVPALGVGVVPAA